jgi:hypothetical protein
MPRAAIDANEAGEATQPLAVLDRINRRKKGPHGALITAE